MDDEPFEDKQLIKELSDRLELLAYKYRETEESLGHSQEALKKCEEELQESQLGSDKLIKELTDRLESLAHKYRETEEDLRKSQEELRQSEKELQESRVECSRLVGDSVSHRLHSMHSASQSPDSRVSTSRGLLEWERDDEGNRRSTRSFEEVEALKQTIHDLRQDCERLESEKREKRDVERRATELENRRSTRSLEEVEVLKQTIHDLRQDCKHLESEKREKRDVERRATELESEVRCMNV